MFEIGRFPSLSTGSCPANVQHDCITMLMCSTMNEQHSITMLIASLCCFALYPLYMLLYPQGGIFHRDSCSSWNRWNRWIPVPAGTGGFLFQRGKTALAAQQGAGRCEAPVTSGTLHERHLAAYRQAIALHLNPSQWKQREDRRERVRIVWPYCHLTWRRTCPYWRYLTGDTILAIPRHRAIGQRRRFLLD